MRIMDKKQKAENKKNPIVPATVEVAPLVNSEAENVDTIRDILFGSQMREFDRKFNQLEKNIASDIEAMRKENSNQMNSLQSFIESEISILSSRISGSEQSQIDELDKLDSTIHKHLEKIESKISTTNTTLDKLSHESSQKFLKQSQDFTTNLSEQMKDARERMDGHRDELSSAKVDRAFLSELLNGVAMQINSDEATKD